MSGSVLNIVCVSPELCVCLSVFTFWVHQVLQGVIRLERLDFPEYERTEAYIILIEGILYSNDLNSRSLPSGLNRKKDHFPEFKAKDPMIQSNHLSDHEQVQSSTGF